MGIAVEVAWKAVAIILFGGLCAARPTLADPILNPANGHYYQVVHSPVDWYEASTAAIGTSWLGISGHLATITSSDENLFLTNTFGAGSLNLCWLGGYQPPGSPEPAGGWAWVTGEPFSFWGWFPSEPNNDGAGSEDRVCFAHPVQPWGKPWNDLWGEENIAGYVVEFPVPEPATGLLFALGAGMMLCRRCRRHHGRSEKGRVSLCQEKRDVQGNMSTHSVFGYAD